MASEKISAMPLATQMFNADVMPIVQGISNLKVNRPMFLTAPPGETIQIASPNSYRGITASDDLVDQLGPGTKYAMLQGVNAVIAVGSTGATFFGAAPDQAAELGNTAKSYIRVLCPFITPHGRIDFHVDAGGVLDVTWGTVHVFQVATSGNMNWQTPPGGYFVLNCGGGFFQIDAGGLIDLENSDSSSVSVGYSPAVAGNWAGAPPAFVHEAIDRIAAAVAGLLGVPIP